MEKRTPFDPKTEIKNIRALSAEERDLPREQRHALRRERLERFKELNALQLEGIAMCIRALKRAMIDSPDVSRKDLQDIVDDYAEKIRFSQHQRELFSESLDLFIQRRNRIEELHHEYKDDPQELFSRCFEFQPQGEISLEQTPFMLYFKAHDIEDYVNAFLYRRSDIPRDPPNQTDTREDAMMSGGFVMKGNELKYPFTNIVAVEKSTLSQHKEKILAHREAININPVAETDDFGQFISLREIKKLVIPLPDAGGTITITCTDTPPKQPDMIGKRITVEMGGAVIFDGTLVRKDKTGKQYYTPLDQAEMQSVDKDYRFWENIYWKDNSKKDRGSKPRLLHDPMIRVPSGQEQHIAIALSSMGLVNVLQTYKSPITADLTRHEWVSGIPRSDPRKYTKIHEEQHIINELFHPVEAESEPLAGIVHRVLEELADTGATTTQIRNAIVIRFCRTQRRLMGVDSQIRDEILAYYSASEPTPYIYETLATESLYRVTGRLYGKKIELLPETFSAELTKALGGVSRTEAKKLRQLFLGHPSAVQGMQKAIRQVFDVGYKRDLKAWIEAIEMLEKHGYSRSQTLSLLYTEPVNSWQKIARRLPERST
ncbi:hypothetical protein HY622_01210 [Candidatus Uhrbacteria bacterium]|nr:hypothetical protein [Candidatus Uhrbacteria bacterium]